MAKQLFFTSALIHRRSGPSIAEWCVTVAEDDQAAIGNFVANFVAEGETVSKPETQGYDANDLRAFIEEIEGNAPALSSNTDTPAPAPEPAPAAREAAAPAPASESSNG